MDITQTHKRHFNLVDVILILCILAIIAGVVLFWLAQDRNLGSYPNITYTVVIEDIPVDVVTAFEVGAPIYDDITGKQIGTLTNHSIQSDENTKTLSIQITATGILNTAHYYEINSYTIIVGKEMSVRIDNFWGEGICTALNPGEKEA